MITRKKYLAVLGVACLVTCLLSFSAQGAQSVYDPNGLDALINSNEVAIQDEIGNYTIAEFDANLDTIVFTMETGDGYPAAGAGTQIDQIVLTEMVSGLDLIISLDPIATFGRIVDNVEDGVTSGSNSLAYKADKTQSVSVVIRFDRDVSGVGLTINRILDDFPVTVYDGNNNPIASYVVPANGAGHSFFGHYAETAEIRKIVLDVGADQRESQFWLDDLAVIAGLPAPCGGDPNYINSNCRSMSSQVGNFTLEEFNSYNTMELFNFEDPGGVIPQSVVESAS